MSCQDILHFPNPALYFGQIPDSKNTLQEPDTSLTAVKPSGPAPHLQQQQQQQSIYLKKYKVYNTSCPADSYTLGDIFIMINFIAVLAKIGH